MRLIFGLLLGLSFPFCAQSCEDLEVHGVWLDPFDNQKINLLCANFSSNEIYSYPAWVIKDGQGNLIAEEQVMYFGIAGTSFHVLEMTEPWQGGHFQLTSHWNCGLALETKWHAHGIGLSIRRNCSGLETGMAGVFPFQ